MNELGFWRGCFKNLLLNLSNTEILDSILCVFSETSSASFYICVSVSLYCHSCVLQTTLTNRMNRSCMCLPGGVSARGMSAHGVSARGGVCPGGICPWGVCPGGCLPVGCLLWGVCPGGVCQGVSAWGCLPGGVCPGGVCPGGCLTRGVSDWWVSDQGGVWPGGRLPRGVCVCQHALRQTPPPMDRILDTCLWKH